MNKTKKCIQIFWFDKLTHWVHLDKWLSQV